MADQRPLSEEDLERLATLIAESLIRASGSVPAASRSGARSVWLPAPVRPEPRPRGGEPPVWSGAGQSLEGVAPGSARTPDAGRAVPIAELTNVARAAAAGRGAAPSTATKGRAARASGPRSRSAKPIEVAVGISNRHV